MEFAQFSKPKFSWLLQPEIPILLPLRRSPELNVLLGATALVQVKMYSPLDGAVKTPV